MSPGFNAIRNNSNSAIAREVLRSPHTIVATISTFVSSVSEIKNQCELLLGTVMRSKCSRSSLNLPLITKTRCITTSNSEE